MSVLQSSSQTPPTEGAPSSQPPTAGAPVSLEGVSLTYGGRAALADISMHIGPGERFALLGPNGSGKSTLLRIVSTLLSPSAGRVRVDGLDLATHPGAVRHRLGVVFQTPGLDGKLSVVENLRFHGYLFGLSGRRLASRIDPLLERFGLKDRRRERVETLSGGLKRRVELAKALLNRPAVLLLDEPSTGLDLAARQVFWETLDELHAEGGLTIIVATHLMEEADRCGRVALLDGGRTVAMDAPMALKRELGETMIVIEAPGSEGLRERVSAALGLEVTTRDGRLHLPLNADPALVPRLMAEFGAEISAVRLGRPTLDDVFMARTGRTIAGDGDEPAPPEEAP